MARFDVYRRARGGYLLDVQSDHLYTLPSRMMVPLLPETTAPPPIRDLAPTLHVGEERVVMMTHFMAAVERRGLGKPLANLLDQSDDITRALGILLNGF